MEQFKNSGEQTGSLDHSELDLGGVILVQKPRHIGNAVFLMILGIPMALVIFAESAPIAAKIGFFAFGSALTLFALWMLWRHWMRVELHERGIQEYRQGRGRSLLYKEVDQLTYSTLRIFMNGSYIHTVQKLALKSDLMPDPPLVCTHIFKEADGKAVSETRTPVVEVRDSVSRALAERLAKSLSRETSIEWTGALRICSRGLEISETYGEWELVEWKRMTKAAIDTETLSIWIDGGSKPRIQVASNTPNFYPIWSLITNLRLKSAQGR